MSNESIDAEFSAAVAKLWHGGAPGLKPGMLILPPLVTGVESCRDYERDADLAPITRPDRVYLVDSEHCARVWAVLGGLVRFRGRASVYEVERPDNIEIDPDYVGIDGDRSFMAPCARVIRGYELSQSAIVRILDSLGYGPDIKRIRQNRAAKVVFTREVSQ